MKTLEFNLNVIVKNYEQPKLLNIKIKIYKLA